MGDVGFWKNPVSEHLDLPQSAFYCAHFEENYSSRSLVRRRNDRCLRKVCARVSHSIKTYPVRAYSFIFGFIVYIQEQCENLGRYMMDSYIYIYIYVQNYSNKCKCFYRILLMYLMSIFLILLGACAEFFQGKPFHKASPDRRFQNNTTCSSKPARPVGMRGLFFRTPSILRLCDSCFRVFPMVACYVPKLAGKPAAKSAVSSSGDVEVEGWKTVLYCIINFSAITVIQSSCMSDFLHCCDTGLDQLERLHSRWPLWELLSGKYGKMSIVSSQAGKVAVQFFDGSLWEPVELDLWAELLGTFSLAALALLCLSTFVHLTHQLPSHSHWSEGM